MFIKTVNVGPSNKSFSDQQWSDGSKWPYCHATRYDYVVLQHSNPIPRSKMWTAHLPNSTYAAECRHNKKWIPVFQRLSDGHNWWFLIMTRWNSQGIETQHHHLIISPFMVFFFYFFFFELANDKRTYSVHYSVSKRSMNLWACVYFCLFSLAFFFPYFIYKYFYFYVQY